jgi:hypothetical protein
MEPWQKVQQVAEGYHAWAGGGLTWCGLISPPNVSSSWSDTTCRKCLEKGMENPMVAPWGPMEVGEFGV